MVVITSPAVFAPRGHYSPGLLIAPDKSWLVLSGQVAVGLDGNTPHGIGAQTRLIWQNIKHLLVAAEMDVSDIVKVTSYLTSTGQIAGFNAARTGILGGAQASVDPADRLRIGCSAIPGRDRGDGREVTAVAVPEAIPSRPPRGCCRYCCSKTSPSAIAVIGECHVRRSVRPEGERKNSAIRGFRS